MWNTNEMNPGKLVIEDGDRVVGTIIRKDDDQWHVEILWSGPGGDLTFADHEYVTALAFCQGVEQVFIRLSQTTVAP